MSPVALITGASRGLGLEIARAYARRGLRLVLTARNEAPLAEAAAELARNTRVIAIPGDVASPEHALRLVSQAYDTFGRIDVLINNASELGPSPLVELQDLDRTTFQDILNVNVVAPLQIIQQVLPAMRQQGSGLIVNVTSDAAVNAYPTWGGYGASKAALEHLSRILAAELEGAGIRVYVVDPGDMNTAMHEAAEPGVDLSHLPGPEAVAPAFVRLLDDPAPFARYEASVLLATAV
ncbi:MAG TPA: SDR family oxidoreductase [Chloroflexota bacterium]|nr:SDR family oxidoreductase [Chloroflexota bacterium]